MNPRSSITLAITPDTHAYLAFRLTGELRTGWGSADPTGLFATMERRWANAILAVLDLRAEHFPSFILLAR